jgi:hypothetical protein
VQKQAGCPFSRSNEAVKNLRGGQGANVFSLSLRLHYKMKAETLLSNPNDSFRYGRFFDKIKAVIFGIKASKEQLSAGRLVILPD